MRKPLQLRIDIDNCTNNTAFASFRIDRVWKRNHWQRLSHQVNRNTLRLLQQQKQQDLLKNLEFSHVDHWRKEKSGSHDTEEQTETITVTLYQSKRLYSLFQWNFSQIIHPLFTIGRTSPTCSNIIPLSLSTSCFSNTWWLSCSPSSSSAWKLWHPFTLHFTTRCA